MEGECRKREGWWKEIGEQSDKKEVWLDFGYWNIAGRRERRKERKVRGE